MQSPASAAGWTAAAATPRSGSPTPTTQIFSACRRHLSGRSKTHRPHEGRAMKHNALLHEHGITGVGDAVGNHYTICPRCSAKRERSHRALKVLGVTIKSDGDVV